MHVAYIHQHFSTPQGSTGTRSYEMGQRLLAAGHRVTIVCGVNPTTQACFQLKGRETEQDIDGLRVICLAEPYANRMGFVRRVLAFGRFARGARRIVDRLDADLVFATSTPLTVGLPGKRSARKHGVPFVFEVRDLWPEIPIALGIVRNPLLKAYLQHMERGIYRAAERIIALSPGMRDGIVSTGYPADSVVMIPNGCDLELFKPDSAPLQDSRFGDPNDFRLVYSGAMGQVNGLDSVLHAALLLKKRGIRGIRFCFIGDGSQRQALLTQVKQSGLQESTSWIEQMPKAELARILPRMDVGLMIFRNVPAFYYGTSPNKFFDYIACGLPVLNNYPGWIADMIGQNNCGAVVPPDDPEAFADAVLDLYERRADLPAMGARSRALAERDFARDKLGAVFVRTLEEVRASWKK
jgi:glycosyltransferase involved in cell wall biosynthesis